MRKFAPLRPPPGAYRLPVMRLAWLSSGDDPEVIQMVFQNATAPGRGRRDHLSISVPLRIADAAGLMRSLGVLRREGVIPLDAEPSPPELDSLSRGGSAA